MDHFISRQTILTKIHARLSPAHEYSSWFALVLRFRTRDSHTGGGGGGLPMDGRGRGA